jgi:hypothetical protein
MLLLYVGFVSAVFSNIIKTIITIIISLCLSTSIHTSTIKGSVCKFSFLIFHLFIFFETRLFFFVNCKFYTTRENEV